MEFSILSIAMHSIFFFLTATKFHIASALYRKNPYLCYLVCVIEGNLMYT